MKRTKPFDIPTLDGSLRRDYASGKITAHDVAVALFRANWYNFVPDETEALQRIGIRPANTARTERGQHK